LTGLECECFPRKDVLPHSFTNADILRAPASQYVSIDAYVAFNYGYRVDPAKKSDRKPERMSSWFCDGEQFIELNRQGVRERAMKENMPSTWAAYATTSYKKHGSLFTKTNTGKQRIWLFEMRLVDMTDMEKTQEWWKILNAALRDNIGRSILESLECPPFLLKKIGIKKWMEFERWAHDKYLSSLYSFLCYLLPSQEELKAENGL